MRNLHKADPNFTHPLTNIVLEAFKGTSCHDESTLACYLAGATTLRIKNSKKDGMDAYLTVAEDVLGCMLEKEILFRDSQGWYRVQSNTED